MSDSSALRDMASFLRKQPPTTGAPVSGEPVQDYQKVIVDALDNALIMIGRSGTEVFHNAMKQLYGLDKTDIVRKPGPYMSALKAMLDTSSDVIEGYILREVRKTKNIAAGSIEDALNKLKAAQ